MARLSRAECQVGFLRLALRRTKQNWPKFTRHGAARLQQALESEMKLSTGVV